MIFIEILIYNLIAFIIIQNFISCKIISYYFRSKVSPIASFNISYETQNILALCFVFSRHIIKSLKSAQPHKPIIEF